MQPISSASKQFQASGTAETAAPRACHRPRHCKDTDTQDQSSVQLKAVKKALLQEVVSTLRARLEVSVSSTARVAGLTDDEQADNHLASAVSSALQSTATPGSTNSPQAVRSSVKDGLQEAATSLKQSGANADDLDAALSQLTDKLDGLFAAFNPPATPDGATEVSAVGARLVTKEKGVLEIHTQQGDVVKIKFASKTDVRAGAAQATSDGQTVSSASVNVSSRSCAQLSVVGDLNDDELKAIQDVVQKVDALAQDFFAGNVDKALSQAAALTIDTDQLATVAVRLSVKQRFEAAAVSVRASPPPVQPAPTTPEPAPVVEAPSTPVSTAPVTDTNATAPTLPVSDTPTEIEPTPPTPSAEAPESEPTSAHSVIAKFVSHVLATFQSTEGETRMTLSFKMKLQLLTSAIEAQQPDASPQSQAAVSKLAEVAETAAAKTSA